MKILLADEEGTVLETWDIEAVWGDISRSLPALTMAREVAVAWQRERNRKIVENARIDREKKE